MDTDSQLAELDRRLRNAADTAASAELCWDKGWGGDCDELDREARKAKDELTGELRRVRAETPELIKTWAKRHIAALEAFIAGDKAAGRPAYEAAEELLRE